MVIAITGKISRRWEFFCSIRKKELWKVFPQAGEKKNRVTRPQTQQRESERKDRATAGTAGARTMCYARRRSVFRLCSQKATRLKSLFPQAAQKLSV